MPRPARFSVDDLLDAAAALVAADGPAAVTMVAVARAVGAPSGSMYHRFSSTAALCGELWMRTEERFLAGLAAAVSGGGDIPTRAVAGAQFTVRWCRRHPDEAQVLLAGADALGSVGWPEEVRARHRRAQRALRRLLAGFDADPDRVTAALVDVPYAVLRRHLLARRAIPPTADGIVADCARALLTN